MAQKSPLTPSSVAARYGVHPNRVIAWIRAGELRALNLAINANGRPRFSILPDDLEAFERSRQACAGGAA